VRQSRRYPCMLCEANMRWRGDCFVPRNDKFNYRVLSLRTRNECGNLVAILVCYARRICAVEEIASYLAMTKSNYSILSLRTRNECGNLVVILVSYARRICTGEEVASYLAMTNLIITFRHCQEQRVRQSTGARRRCKSRHCSIVI
jgi:hypothetical protein